VGSGLARPCPWVGDVRQGPRVGGLLEHPLKYPGTTNKLNPSPKTEYFLIS